MNKVQTQKSLSAKLVSLFTSVALVLSFIPCMVLPQVALAEDEVVFTVYTQAYEGAESKLAKAYTASQLEALVDDSADAIAGQYVKNGSIGVWASDEYVTFADLFDDAGVAWESGYTYKWGGSAEKSGNTYTYEQLQNRKFLPNASVDKTTGAISFSEEGATIVTPALALTAHRAFASQKEGDSTTAADAKTAALASSEAATKLVPIIGASADEIKSASPAGKPYWTDTDSITVVAPASVSLSTENENVAVGDTFEVDIAVQTSCAIASAEASITYDSNVATIASIAYAEKVENGVSNDFNNEVGTAKLSFFGDASFDAKEGFTFATITFKAVSTGNASIAVSDAVAAAALPSESSCTDISLTALGSPLVVPVAEERVVFTVYTQAYEGAESKLAKAYTASQLEALVDDSADAIAGQYVKNGSIGVWASDEYVTFADLFDDAGVAWESGYTYKWGGSAEKSGNTYTYEQLQNRKFLPNASVDKTTGAISFSEEGATIVTPALALTAHRAFASQKEGDSTTAADAKTAALASSEAATKLVPIIGASADEIKSASPAGKPYWTDTDSITVVAPAKVSSTAYAGNYYKVTYTAQVENGKIVSMGDQEMNLDSDNNEFVALATKDQITAFTMRSFSVSDGTPTTLVHDGDMNANKTVNVVDAQIAYDVATQRYTNFEVLSMDKWLAGDVNNDGVFDSADALAIQYKALYGEFKKA